MKIRMMLSLLLIGLLGCNSVLAQRCSTCGGRGLTANTLQKAQQGQEDAKVQTADGTKENSKKDAQRNDKQN